MSPGGRQVEWAGILKGNLQERSYLEKLYISWCDMILSPVFDIILDLSKRWPKTEVEIMLKSFEKFEKSKFLL